MGFFNWISQTDLGASPLFPLPFRVAMFGENAVFVENARCLKEYQPQKVVVGVSSGELAICGEGLIIKKFGEGDMLVCGKIKSVQKQGK